jgi:hypothetical protein
MAAPHRICDVKIPLANSEPSTHGPSRLSLAALLRPLSATKQT